MTGRQRSLLIEEPPLQVLPKLAAVIGLNEAIVLQQIHYWLGRSNNIRDDRKWVYKTAQEWVDEFPFWSEATVKRAIASLKDRKLIDVQKESRTSWNRTNWYSVNYEALSSIGAICTDAAEQVDPVQPAKLTGSIGSDCAVRSDQPAPITSTETTSKTTSEKPATLRPGEDYTPPASVIDWAKKMGVDRFLPLHIEQFRDSCTTQQRKPYLVSGLDAAFRKSVREDWGGVRRQAQAAERRGERVPALEKGGAGVVLKAEAGLEYDDGTTCTLDENIAGGDPETIARQVIRTYATTRRFQTARRIYVRQGADRRVFAIAELRA